MLTGGRDGRIRAWDPRATNPKGQEAAPSAPANRGPQGYVLESSPSLDRLSSPNGRFAMYPGDPRQPPPTRHDTVLQFQAGVERALAPDGQFLAFRGTNGLGHIVNLETGQETASFPLPHIETIRGVSHDGRLLATTLSDGTVLLREPPFSTTRSMPNAHRSPISALTFAPQQPVLATAGPDGWLRVWNGRDLRLTTEARLPAKTHFEGPKALTFDPAGQLVACGENTDSRVLVLRLSPVRMVRYVKMPFYGWDTRALAWSQDGRSLLVTSGADQAALIDWQSGRVAGLIGESGLGWEKAAFTPDGRRVVLGVGGKITRWDVRSKRQLLDLFLSGDINIDQVGLDPIGERLAVTLGDVCKVFTAPRSGQPGL